MTAILNQSSAPAYRIACEHVLLYYITDRLQFPGSPAEQRRALLATIAAAARAGVDFIQLREKDLSVRELETLAREAAAAIQPTTKLLINSRADVALAAGAGGVHLPAGDLAASEVRAIVDAVPRAFAIGVSCHTVEEVRAAKSHGADFAVFGPVFHKSGKATSGLAALRAACAPRAAVAHTEGAYASGMPVLALGGVTLANAAACLRARAAGLAGIRLFQQAPDLGSLVGELRALALPETPDRHFRH
jgi:thiamine-phosphate pyrophosphorylase